MKAYSPVAVRLASCVLVASVLAFSGPLVHAESVAKFVVALKPDKDPDKMLEEKKQLADNLSAALGKPVEVIIPLSDAVIQEGLANGTIDLAYLSATGMVEARKNNSAEILVAGEIDGEPSYKSYWVTLKEKPYTSVEQLKGKPVAFASKTSTSGKVVPHWDLIKRGLLPANADPEVFFGKGNVFYGTGYVTAIERVLSGDAEVAAVSYYVLDKDKHLTAEQRAKLKKVCEQGPVPTHVIAVRSTLSKEDIAALRKAVLALNDEANIGLRDKVFTSKLVEVDTEAHLGPIREALAVTEVK